MTIDSITSVIRNARNFGIVAVEHALNDLFASGTSPVAAALSFCLEEKLLSDGTAWELIEGAKAQLSLHGVTNTNIHTFGGPQTSITVSALGLDSLSQAPPSPGESYSVLLTKPLGSSLCYYLACLTGVDEIAQNCENVMLRSHSPLCKAINQWSRAGSTDISGFGLVGHLCALSDFYQLTIDIDSNAIPFSEGSQRFSQSAFPECSSKRNAADFASRYSFNAKVSEFEHSLLFNGETSGPLALLVPQADVKAFIEHTENALHWSLANIGVATMAKVGSVTIY